MNITILILGLLVAGEILTISWMTFSLMQYKSLCAQLTASIKNMYCKHKGCKNIRYSDTPVDGNTGFITLYCQTHLMEHAEPMGTSD